MKKWISRIPFQLVLPCLVLGAVFTLPHAVTWSKYAWQDTIQITRKVNYAEQVLTRILTAVPDVICTLEGNGIKINEGENPGQWILTPEEGYALPESLIVKVGETEYIVYTNGRSNPGGISFDPEARILIIADSLLMDSQGSITLIVSGVAVLDQTNVPENSEPVQGGEPVEDSEPVEGEAIPNDSTAADGLTRANQADGISTEN